MENGKFDKIILDWMGSPVERGVDWLVSQSKRTEFIDLSHLWILTQTSGAGRRLREALAQISKEKGQGCLLPKMSTPDSLIKPSADSIDGFQIATPIQVLAHWMMTLKENELSNFPDLFPRIPQVLDVSWGLSISRALVQLRQTLAEANHDCQSVEESRLTEQWAEQDRWSDLARLEKLYRTRLQRRGLIDPMDAGRRWVRKPDAPKGIEGIVLFGVSGFPDLGKTALLKLIELGLSVRVLLYCAPGEESDSFDEVGRPIRAAWESRPLPLSDAQLHLTYGPREQARFAVERMSLIARVNDEHINLGVLDPEVTEALIEEGAHHSEFPLFHDPEGNSGDQSALYFWLKAIQDLMGTGGMIEATNLLRFPMTIKWLEAEGVTGDEREWLKELDRLHVKNLPEKLKNGLYFAKRSDLSVLGALQQIDALIERLKKGVFEEEVKNLLKVALSKESFDRSKAEDQSFIELLPKIGDWLTELSGLSGMNFEERYSLLLRMITQVSWVDDLTGDEMKLHGWLELAWADAPRMIILGCNDAFLPESLPMDSFIPQSLRRELGLWTDDDRKGRDSYLLHWLISSHGGTTGVDFVMGKFSRDGSPLKPSPLFFLCDLKDNDTLPNRTEKLFGEVPPEAKNPAWAYPWKLQSGRHEPVRSISVTSFRSFLSCPFRFYLKKKFGMDKYDSGKAEADIMDFGTLAHSAVEALNNEGGARLDEDGIFNELKKKLETDIFKRFGKNLGLSLLQQKASIERRLSKVAQLHFIENLEGWEILKIEEKFFIDTCGSKNPQDWQILPNRDAPLQSERSVRIVGMIDRIDYHPQREVFRLLDYKTSSKGPEQLHLKGGVVRMDEYPKYAKFLVEGKTKRWTDLQLPLYRLWAEKALINKGGQSLEVGVFNLPAKEEEIGIHLWGNLDDELMKEAMNCAVGVIEDLLDPAEHHPISKVDYDDFEDLFFHSPEGAIELFSK